MEFELRTRVARDAELTIAANKHEATWQHREQNPEASDKECTDARELFRKAHRKRSDNRSELGELQEELFENAEEEEDWSHQ